MTEDIVEAVARAYAKVADGADFDALTPAGQEMYAKRVMLIITAYEAARGDFVVVPREPTEAMLKAALARPPLSIPFDARTSITADYRAMIAASQGER